MTKSLLSTVAGFVMSMWSISVAMSQELPTVNLALDFSIQGQQSPFILAADGGYFERAGVKVTVDRGYGSADSIGKVAAGTYDMAFADIGAMIQFNGRRQAGNLISVFQVYDDAPMVVLALKKSGISKPSDLVGKKLASPPAASSRVMFPLFAAATKLDPSTIQWLDVTPQLRETMLVQGQADASVAFITDLAGLDRLNITEQDLNVMKYADYGVNLYGHGIIVKEEYAKANPEIVKKVIKGFVEALKASITDPNLPIAAIKKRDPLVSEQVERVRLQHVIDAAIVTDHVKKEGLSSVDPARMQKTIDTVASVFKLPAMEVKSTYSAEYLPAKSDLMLK